MKGSTELILRALPHYRDNNIRYEIMDLLCPHLNINNSWLLKYGLDMGGWKALMEQVEEQPKRWRKKKSVLINALSTMDYPIIRQQYNDIFPWRDNPVSETLRNILEDQEDWDPLFLLASAQMLLD